MMFVREKETMVQIESYCIIKSVILTCFNSHIFTLSGYVFVSFKNI